VRAASGPEGTLNLEVRSEAAEHLPNFIEDSASDVADEVPLRCPEREPFALSMGNVFDHHMVHHQERDLPTRTDCG